MSADHEDVGYLTWGQFQRLRQAVSTAQSHVWWWRVAGYLKHGNDPDEFRGSHSKASSLPIGLPATWLAADEVTRLLNELNWWPELSNAANSLDGSELATSLINEVETAAARWPLEDKPRDVKFFRCTACNAMTLRYYPPQIEVAPEPSEGDADTRWRIDSEVKCMNRTCNAVIDEAMFARMAVVIEAEQKAKDERTRQLAKSQRSNIESEPVAVNYLLLGEAGTGEDDAAGEGVVAVSA